MADIQSLPRGVVRRDNDAARTHGWTVFLQRRGRVVIKLFSDGVWGGRDKALAAAIRFHRSMSRKLRAFSLADYCDIKKRNNRSGIPGVCRNVYQRESGGKSIYWVASCPIGRGQQKHIKFSVTKYGEKGAREKAIEARRRALRALSRVPAWQRTEGGAVEQKSSVKHR